MKIYDTVYSYLQNAKVGDIITLSGVGLYPKLDVSTRYGTYRVHELTDKNSLAVTSYKRSGVNFIPNNYYSQSVGVLDNEEFFNLKNY